MPTQRGLACWITGTRTTKPVTSGWPLRCTPRQKYPTTDQIAQVIAAHPRAGFTDGILRAFHDRMKDRPETTFGTMNDDPGTFRTGVDPNKARRPHQSQRAAAVRTSNGFTESDGVTSFRPIIDVRIRPISAAVRRFRDTGVWRDAGQMTELHRCRDDTPDAPPIKACRADGDAPLISYAELARHVERFAGALYELGDGRERRWPASCRADRVARTVRPGRPSDCGTGG